MVTQSTGCFWKLKAHYRFLGLDKYDTLTTKVTLERNKALLVVTDDSTEVIVLDPKTEVTLDIRSSGNYKYQQAILQQMLSK